MPLALAVQRRGAQLRVPGPGRAVKVTRTPGPSPPAQWHIATGTVPVFDPIHSRLPLPVAVGPASAPVDRPGPPRRPQSEPQAEAGPLALQVATASGSLSLRVRLHCHYLPVHDFKLNLKLPRDPPSGGGRAAGNRLPVQV
jgi:hypothetical protein